MKLLSWPNLCVTDVGLVDRIRIGHDNKGMAAGWHLDRVEVAKKDGTGNRYQSDSCYLPIEELNVQ